MALGDNNTFNSEPFRPVTYGYGMTNPDAKYEKTSLSFAIWKFMLKATIAPKVNDGGTYDKYDKDNGISIYLNVNKAITLMKILDEFKELYQKDNKVKFNKGVATNIGVIVVSNGEYVNGGIPTITIAKVNESGSVTQILNYEIKIGSDFAVLNYDNNTGKYTTETDPYAYNEFELLHYQLEQYVLGQSGGISGACYDAVNFGINKVRDDARKIAEKLGVDLNTSSHRNNYSRTSYFNNGGNSGSSEGSYNQTSSGTTRNTTLEDLEMA